MAKKKVARYLMEEAAAREAAEAVARVAENRDPLVAQVLATPVRMTRDGNDEEILNHDVALLGADKKVERDVNGNINKVPLTETYTYHKKHREQHEPGSGLWKVSKAKEKESFQNCRANGAFTKWKTNTHKGWGLIFDANSSVPAILGQGVDHEGNMSDVKVCKFVEGNAQRWHGYPINYRSLNEETICDSAFEYWEKTLNVIDKSDINDIKNKEESPLS